MFRATQRARHARAAGDVTREVLEDVRWSMDAIEPWGEGKDGLSAVAGRTASSSTWISGVCNRKTVSYFLRTPMYKKL